MDREGVDVEVWSLESGGNEKSELRTQRMVSSIWRRKGGGLRGGGGSGVSESGDEAVKRRLRGRPVTEGGPG